jgi:decaprenyl-phosphate phosphoribosyltransferase
MTQTNATTIEETDTVAGNLPASATTNKGLWATLVPYAAIARPDHWFKNVFMLAGVLLAYFYYAGAVGISSLWQVFLALVSTCLVASSNYVINEILDAPTDRSHPVKRNRPIPAGLVRLPLAYAEWIALGIVGLALAWMINLPFLMTAAALWVMGVIYNVPPVRSKDHPYIDVLSESVNNPLRLLLGWFALVPAQIPPVSLLLSYWFVGAFFMASKRFAEYRGINDATVAGAYRSSFKFYDESRLLVSMFFYSSAAALFLGVFIIRYHLELILCVPLIAGFFGYYMHVTLKPESAAATPERLYREKGLMLYLVICVAAFVGLMFVQIPALYDLFNIPASEVPPLWRL